MFYTVVNVIKHNIHLEIHSKYDFNVILFSRGPNSLKSSQISSQISNFFKPSQEKNTEFKTQDSINLGYENNIEIVQPSSSVQDKLSVYKKTTKQIDKLIKETNKPCDSKENAVTTFLDKNKFNDSLDDFEIPKRAKLTQTKPLPLAKKIAKPKVTRIKRSTKKLSDEKMFCELMKCQSRSENVDPDEMQMALALSLSIVESFNVTEKDENCTTKPCTKQKSAEERLVDIQHTLENFGFKSGYSPADLNVILGVNRNYKNRRKFSKRTLEYLRKPLQNRIDNIIETSNVQNIGNVKDYKIFSDFLKTFKSTKSMFQMQTSNTNTANNLNEFYVNNLVEQSNLKCGYLLRDWNKIPGRDKSPIRNLETIIKELSVTVVSNCEEINDDDISHINNNQSKNEGHCIYNTGIRENLKSPDMFSCSESDVEDDNEREYILYFIKTYKYYKCIYVMYCYIIIDFINFKL